MTHPAAELGRLLLVAFFMVGPVVGLMLVLNARDRREQALLERAWALAPRELRDRTTIRVHCRLLSMRRLVEADVWGCTRDEIGGAIARWCTGLPPGARLVVNGIDRGVSARFARRQFDGRRPPAYDPSQRPTGLI